MNEQQASAALDTAQIVVKDETLPSVDVIPQRYGRLAGQGSGLDIRVRGSAMATVPPISTGTGASAASGALDNVEIASNFTTFLQLLTTQLKNQNPLDPLDTNQFTQQLVQFAQVEQ